VEIRPITGCTTLSVHLGNPCYAPCLTVVAFRTSPPCWRSSSRPALAVGRDLSALAAIYTAPTELALDAGPLRRGVRQVASCDRAGVIDDRERGIFLPAGDPGFELDYLAGTAHPCPRCSSTTSGYTSDDMNVHDYSGRPGQAHLSPELARRGHHVEHQYCASYTTGRGATERHGGDPESLWCVLSRWAPSLPATSPALSVGVSTRRMDKPIGRDARHHLIVEVAGVGDDQRARHPGTGVPGAFALAEYGEISTLGA
jgi:hypothetical protein